MSALLWVIPGVAVGFAAIWVVRNRLASQASGPGPESEPQPQPERPLPASPPPVASDVPALKPEQYQALAVSFGHDACDAVRELRDKRFLWKETPRLPVPGCDRTICKCRFEVYSDRRSGRDTRDNFAAYGDFRSDMSDARRRGGAERRQK
jgi:hypothetical protein